MQWWRDAAGCEHAKPRHTGEGSSLRATPGQHQSPPFRAPLRPPAFAFPHPQRLRSCRQCVRRLGAASRTTNGSALRQGGGERPARCRSHRAEAILWRRRIQQAFRLTASQVVARLLLGLLFSRHVHVVSARSCAAVSIAFSLFFSSFLRVFVFSKVEARQLFLVLLPRLSFRSADTDSTGTRNRSRRGTTK